MDQDFTGGTPGLLPATAPETHQQPNAEDFARLKMQQDLCLSPTLPLPDPSAEALKEAKFIESVKVMLGEILSPLTHQMAGVQAKMGEISSDISTLNCQLLDRTRRLEELESRLQEEEEEEVDPAL